MQFKTLLTRLAAASALALAAVGAHAETYDFTLTGSGFNASWQLASAPTPDYVANGMFAVFGPITGTFSGGAVSLYFFSAAYGGGLGVSRPFVYDLPNTTGPQIYTGSESAPIFSVGSFDLIDHGSPYTLTISAISAVPEPATVGLMLAGLGVVGGIAARRRKAFGKEDAAC